MQYSIIAAFLAAAVGINAAPGNTLVSRVPSIPLSIYTDNGCQTPATGPVEVLQIRADNVCQNITYTPPSTLESAKIESRNLAALPGDCRLLAWNDFNCTGNFITFDRVSTPNDNSPCRTFGSANNFIRSARTVGRCN
ncbi:hypothetical protein T440DRAFT_517418 [Plenodomus tracheiphilus IPT5]|uniref:Uncharacterized protein n=1 Tax=Plenodomus tracheiphilus IPT5 TaxID=1408161 RepID=A0A6A7B788_9PLEO|nr:hypothetical protein T440DRAFT_517418 [Plenodomus tracheiphilus IPT5]